jgi:hypothetical protein
MALHTLFTGFTDLNGLRTKGTTPRVISTNLLNFSYGESGTDNFVKKQVAGKQADQQSLGATLERRLTIVSQFVNFEQYGLMFNAEEKTFTNFTVPQYAEFVVPAAGGAVTLSEITAGNAATVVSCYNGDVGGKRGPLTRVTVAPTTAGTVQVSAGTLTFSAADGGKTIGIIYDRTYTSGKGYGGPGAKAKLGQMEFTGKTVSTATSSKGMIVWIPECERLSEATIEINGDGVPEISNVFNCTIPTGWPDAYALYDEASLLP